MTTRKPVIVGPFSKGINTYDDPTAIDDHELAEALNFDPGLDGSLKSRPPFSDLGSPLTITGIGVPRLLGYFYDTNGDPHLIASDGNSSTWRYSGTSWVLVTNTFSATDMTQFDGKAWLVSPVGEADPGGSWDPTGGFVADSNMPHGTSIAAYKSRLWIAEGSGGANPTRIRYSKVLGQPDFWDAAGFLDVGYGDGQYVVKIVTYFDVMLVFRTKSIWSFQFGIDPGQAIQSVVVPGVGLQGKHALVPYESYLYFMYDEKAYQFINNRVVQINMKVPFTSLDKGSTRQPYTVSLFNNRILYSYYEVMYVYSLRTQTWTTWRSDSWGPIGQLIMPYVDDDTDIAYALPSGTRFSTSVPLLKIEDRLTEDVELMQCSLQTKNYNFDVPGSFKVLFWWGIDAIFKTGVQGTAVPGTYTLASTWGQLLSKTWGDLLSGTWAHPYMQDPSVVSDVGTGAGPLRKFVKFFKKLRFRQLYFRVAFNTDGSSSTAPVQVFTLSAYMAEKETVSKAVT